MIAIYMSPIILTVCEVKTSNSSLAESREKLKLHAIGIPSFSQFSEMSMLDSENIECILYSTKFKILRTLLFLQLYNGTHIRKRYILANIYKSRARKFNLRLMGCVWTYLPMPPYSRTMHLSTNLHTTYQMDGQGIKKWKYILTFQFMSERTDTMVLHHHGWYLLKVQIVLIFFL